MRRARIRFNYSDYLLLPEDKRYEVLDGALNVVPAPSIRHQRVSKRLQMALVREAEETGFGEILGAPCDVVLSQEDVVQPDILFIRTQRSGIVGESNVQGSPDLVIEIISPATRGRDIELKRKIYAAYRVQEYWIVDPEAETIEVLVLGEQGYAGAGVYGISNFLSSPLLPELNLNLGRIFRP